MPRLYREAPLASIWEGSGNVQCLDVLRAMIKNPDSVEAYFAEVARAHRSRGSRPRPRRCARSSADMTEIEARARRIVERMALLLQGSLMVRYADEASAAFCPPASPATGARRSARSGGTDFTRIIERHRAAV